MVGYPIGGDTMSVTCCASLHSLSLTHVYRHSLTLSLLQEGVTVVGYPIGGDTMSVTSGVVSRIEVTSYVHGAAELLGIQIDAAVSVLCVWWGGRLTSSC